MKLKTLTIKNFRSITRASKIPLTGMTVLLGPNNEGKSNVLRALVIAMRTVLGRPGSTRRAFGPPPDDIYHWERDYPVQLQDSHPGGHSEFVLEFDLTPKEQEQFLRDVGSKVKTPLPIEVRLGPEREAKIAVRKRGPGSAKVTEKRLQIAKFLADRLDFDYIPAVRTADAVDLVIHSLLSRELAKLESQQAYAQALAKIREIQQPILVATGLSGAHPHRRSGDPGPAENST